MGWYGDRPDPDTLAFDGTSNSDQDSNITNVVKFRDAYQADPNEPINPQKGTYGAHSYYITGAGRDDDRSGLDAGAILGDTQNLDLANGDKTGDRVLIMASNFLNYINQLRSLSERGELMTDHVNIDIVGFSRGASEARIFANLLDSFLNGADSFVATNGAVDDSVNFNTPSTTAFLARQFLQQSCFNVNLRFLGLWDTVSHIGVLESSDSIESFGPHGDAYLGIPSDFDFTAQAVALHEGRAVFDAWSIYDNPNQKINPPANQLEKGFIGNHTNIGGAGTGDLSDIALNWVIKQGVDHTSIRQPNLPDEYKQVTNPLVNDDVYQPVFPGAGRLYYPGREFRYLDYGDDTDVSQKEYRVPGGIGGDLDFERSKQFIEKNIYTDTLTPFVGDDDLHHTTLTNAGSDYQGWLKANYGLDIDINDVGLKRENLD